MSTIPFADHFLAGSILSLLLPVGLLIVIALWYVIAVSRLPGADSNQPPPPPAAADRGPSDPPGASA
jgi:hypothetical protein